MKGSVKIGLFLFVFLSVKFGYGQSCEWVKGQYGNSDCYSSVVASNHNNFTVMGMTHASKLDTGSLLYDTSDIYVKEATQYILGVHPDGSLKWTCPIETPLNVNSAEPQVIEMLLDSQNNTYVLGQFWGDKGDSIVFPNGEKLIVHDSVKTGFIHAFIAKIDSSWNCLWVKGVFNIAGNGGYYFFWSFKTMGMHFNSKEYPCIMISNIKQPFIVDDSLWYVSKYGYHPHSSNFIIEFNDSGNFVHGFRLAEFTDAYHTTWDGTVVKDNQNNSYFLLEGRGHLLQDTDTLSSYLLRYNLVLFKYDSIGNYLGHIKIIKNPRFSNFFLTKLGDKIMVSGLFSSSTHFFDSRYNVGNYPHTPNFPYNGFQYFAIINNNLEVDKIKFADKDCEAGFIVSSHKTNNRFTYLGGYAGKGIFKMDGIEYKFDDIGVCLIKMDTAGTILWAFSNKARHATITDISPDTGANLMVSGYFFDSLQLFNQRIQHHFLTRSQNHGGFIGKINDYSITRGDVIPGPFCAGDSFSIPYTIIGKYDKDSNEFVAELSDEWGTFENGGRELGRLKHYDSGTIQGVLPLFDVVTSGNYRIRIRSTHPPVQSYYKVDKLRLLVYSKDKADPGPSDTICRGDTFQLSTKGGSVWQWSPGHEMNNSSLRQPLVYPSKTTTYRIIIDDTSGCGERDTAYKEIIIRPHPTVSQLSGDTITCLSSTVPLVAKFTGGKPGRYYWQWFTQDTSHTLLNEGSNEPHHPFYDAVGTQPRLLDTLFYTLPLEITDSQRVMVLLWDTCSYIPDTAFFTIKINQYQPDFNLSFYDTAICPNEPIQVIADFEPGYSDRYYWNWYSTGFKHMTSDSGQLTDTLFLTLPLKKIKHHWFYLEFINGCSPLRDTIFTHITSKPPLKITSHFASQVFCKGKEVVLIPKGAGGDSLTHKWQWRKGQNAPFLYKDTLKLITDTSVQIQLVLTDECMPEGDTQLIQIGVQPPLSAAILYNQKLLKDTTLCFGSTLNLAAKAEGGNKNQYSFKWLLDGEIVGKDSTLQHHFIQQSDTQHTLQLVVDDGCTLLLDTAEVSVKIRQELKADATVTDTVCLGQEVSFTALPKGGLTNDYSYTWKHTNTVLSNDSLLLSVWPETVTGWDSIQLILSDGCSMNDTIYKHLFFRSPLNLAITTTDSCTTDSLALTAQASGGLTTGHQLKWWDENNQTLGTQTMLTVTPNPVNTYWAVLTDGCTITPDTASIKVGQTPTLNVSTNPNQGCEPLEVTFKLKTEYKGHYQWVFEDGKGTQTVFNPEDSIVLMEYTRGSYTPTLKLTTDFGCVVNWQSTGLTAFPKPIADFSYQPEKPSLDSPEVHFINLSVDADSFAWDLGGYGKSTEEQPIVLYEAEGKYPIQLIAKNIYQCSDTALGFLTVKPGYFIYLPNAFSPNGDGLNDRFSPVASGIDIIEFEIYNRWGECMFKGQQGDSWDGTYLGKPVPQGVYVCVLPVAAKDQNNERVRGSFLLIR